jgi:chromate transport protein ChrA
MIKIQLILLFDISMVILMIILAYLSKRLGDALKIKPYYKGLFVTAFIIILASCFDFITTTLSQFSIPYLSLSLRFISGCTAFLICLKYWKWLFSEFFKS